MAQNTLQKKRFQEAGSEYVRCIQCPLKKSIQNFQNSPGIPGKHSPLLTYHSSDPGWSSSGAGDFVANTGGRIGAWISDFLFSWFGFAAFLFPLMMFGISYHLFQCSQKH